MESVTKIIQLELSALTRVTYMEHIEVPSNISKDELDQLINDRYNQIDGGEYVSDPDYWKQAGCHAYDSDTDDQPTMMAFRTEQGMQIERADSNSCERAKTSVDRTTG